MRSRRKSDGGRYMRARVNPGQNRFKTAILALFVVAVASALGGCVGAVSEATSKPAPGTLSLTMGSLPGATAGTAYDVTLVASGGTTPYSWSISSGSLPAGLSLAASTGIISGSPTTANSYSFTVKVTDADSNTASESMSITVAAAQPPTISTTSLPNGTVSTAYSTTLAATGGATPYSWTISSGSLPAGLSLTASTGAISGTPTTANTYSFTVKVTDANSNTATKSLSITIAAAAQPPTISTTSLPNGTVSTAYSTTLTATGGATPYSWTISSGSLPAGLSLTASTGAISGTPTTANTYSFTVKVTDANSNTATKSLSITIAAAAQPPTITTTSLPSGTVGVAYSGTLVATGGATPYSWTISSGSLPAGLSLTASTGAISGTPTTANTYSFTVKVTDANSNTATKSLSITISATVQPPTIITSSLPAGETNTSYSSSLSASGGVLPYTWSITTGSLPAGLTLSASAGTITGVPTATGTSTFTVQVADSSSPAKTATASLSISVTAGTAHSVYLTIGASSSPGVTGYNIYRSNVSGTGYLKITPTPITSLNYSDATVDNGQTYYYVATAVDGSGDESGYSDEVQMVIP
jgi:hypothetical protein